MDNSWIEHHAAEEIEGARLYFKKAMECQDPEEKEKFICMGQQELEHAGLLYSMLH